MSYLNYFTFILLSSVFSDCNKKSTQNTLNILSLVSEISDSYSDGRTEKQITKHKIAYYENYTLYEVGSVVFSVKTTNSNGVIHNEARETTDTIYKYFIVEKNKNSGFVYDSLKGGRKKLFKLDSLKNDLGINEENLDVYGVSIGIPSKIARNQKTNKIEFEEYHTKKLKTDPDTVFRYYDSRMKKYDFSFSLLLEKEKGTKLVKTHFVYLQEKKTNSKIAYKTRTDFVDYIAEIRVSYSQDLINLFGQFRKDSKSIRG